MLQGLGTGDLLGLTRLDSHQLYIRHRTGAHLQYPYYTIKNNEIITRVHEERKHNISFFSIPAQFPLNAFPLCFLYAYLTAKQYHTGTICWINQCENRGVFYAGGRAKTSCGWLLSQKVLFVYAVTFSFFRYGCLSHTPAFHNPEILGYTFLLPQSLPWHFSLK